MDDLHIIFGRQGHKHICVKLYAVRANGGFIKRQHDSSILFEKFDY